MARLSDQDIEILDLLVDEGFDVDDLQPEQEQRAEKISSLLSLLEPEEKVTGTELMIQRTLEAAKQEQKKSFKMETPADVLQVQTGRGGMRWRDLMGVAAMIVVCVTVSFPVMNNARLRARQTVGQSNLSQIAAGMTAYASENADQMPMAPMKLSSSWWNPKRSTEHEIASNSAHLFHLARTGYVDAKSFNDPGNPHGVNDPDLNAMDWKDPRQVSYSYQNQFDGDPDYWTNSNSRPVVADKNPHFEAGRQVKREVNTDSRNHGRLGGQNVLYSDGSVKWMREPVTEDGDHIYLRGRAKDQVSGYSGEELPEHDNDVFLVW